MHGYAHSRCNCKKTLQCQWPNCELKFHEACEMLILKCISRGL